MGRMMQLQQPGCTLLRTSGKASPSATDDFSAEPTVTFLGAAREREVPFLSPNVTLLIHAHGEKRRPTRNATP